MFKSHQHAMLLCDQNFYSPN